MAKTQVVELIRVSTAGQAREDRESLPAQRSRNQRTIEQNGLESVREFQIVDVSGSDVLDAPEMQELVRTIYRPEIKGVVTAEFSRLMRPENFADIRLLQEFVESNTVI